MKKKITWLAISCLMIAALVLGSCAPAEAPAPTPAPGPEMVKVTLTKLDGSTMVKEMEKPKYGGWFIGALHSPIIGFDPITPLHNSQLWVTALTNDEMLMGNYTLGPTGTDEATWVMQGFIMLPYYTGALAESWEFPDDTTVVVHFRKGVRWQNKPPVNGREFTAADAAWSLTRVETDPKSYIGMNYGKFFVSAEATDKYTMVLKVKPGSQGEMVKRTLDFHQVTPREVVEQYGDMTQWENVVGTGPFMMEDYVPGSQATLERNPDYFMKDPFFPENQLPYLDGVKWLIIEDVSTRIASLRTHKIDWLQTVGWEDAQSIMKTNPEMKYSQYIEAAHQNVIYMRTDKPELPFYDKRVRHALNLGLDQRAITDEYYGGNAELMSCPVAPYPEYAPVFTSLEDSPEYFQKEYGYYPEEAKQLLAEAGYPDGFKTKILCSQRHVDLLSIVADQWSKIGVDLELEVKDYSVYRSMRAKRAHDEMILGVQSTVSPAGFLQYRIDNYQNSSMINDPFANETYKIVAANTVINEPKVFEALNEFYPYSREQSWWVETPSPHLWTMWSPWIKQYSGEQTVGFCNFFSFPRWIWCDQDLKEEMTGER